MGFARMKKIKEFIKNTFQLKGFKKFASSIKEFNCEFDNIIIEEIEKGHINCINWNKLTDKKEVGFGNFGSVYKAYYQKENDYVIVKKLIDSDDIQNIKEAIQHEIQMQIRAHNCENITRLLGITRESPNDNYCIVTEYADGGDLRNYLKNNFSTLDWNKKYQLANDIANGLHHLHNNNIIHRDLHAKNIVIKKGRAKIIDFGYAKNEKAETRIHKKEAFGMTSYMAPELLDSSLHSKKTDIYSLGVLFWELSSGYPPFQNLSNEIALIWNVINGVREQKIPNTPLSYYKLYDACWNVNPEERPIIEDVCNKLKNMLFN